jgi:hypothetical protein
MALRDFLLGKEEIDDAENIAEEAAQIVAEASAADPEVQLDPEPKRESPKAFRPSAKGTASKVRVTAAEKRDIRAKVEFILAPSAVMIGNVDPFCGPVFTRQAPEIAQALTDIICDSPDLVRWFTGAGSAGGYMKYLTLVMACLPVGTVVFAHHVTHSIGEPPPDTVPEDWSQYNAPG